jgi:ankyrin repeat protein
MDYYQQIERGDLPALREALESGLDPNDAHGGASLLMMAALHGRTDVGRLLIEFGADINYVQPVDRVLNSAVECAVHSAHPKFVRLLLQNGASVAPLQNWTASREWFRKYSRNTEATLAKISELVEAVAPGKTIDLESAEG